MYAGAPKVPPRVLASGPKPCGGNEKNKQQHKSNARFLKNIKRRVNLGRLFLLCLVSLLKFRISNNMGENVKM